MKVKVKKIPLQGLNLDEVVKPADLDLEAYEFSFLSPLKIHAHLEKAADAVIADVSVAGQYGFTCARCLEPVEQQRTDVLKLYFDITPQTEEIDLDDEIRQEMVMAISPIVLCKPNCRGICPDCKSNLNKEPCRCKPKPPGKTEMNFVL